MSNANEQTAAEKITRVTIRKVRSEDLAGIVSIDAAVTGLAKADYWNDIFVRYSERRTDERFFFVADADHGGGDRIIGYIVGEIRAWEFGSEPCGWVFAFSVDPGTRLQGIGERLFAHILNAFRNAGVRTMRTMVARDNNLHLSFFRSEGMTAGSYIQLEMEIDNWTPGHTWETATEG